jgi:HlyD family secretion protein
MQMSRKSALILAATVAVLVAAGAVYAWWNSLNGATEYRLAKVERGGITAAVATTGTVNPVTQVQVGSQVSGQVKELFVDFNSEVKKGQIIARIDSDSFNLRVNQALADLEAARATVLSQRANAAALQAEVARARVNSGEAERELQRNKGLFEKNFVSAAALDKAQAAFEAAREQHKAAQAQLAAGHAQVTNVEALVRQREAQLSQSKVDLDRTTIRAPVDGIVVKKSVEPGQTVAASLQAPELFVIAQDLRSMQVDTSIDEAEIGRIREGQQASFTVDSFPGRMFRGQVAQVRRAATVVQNVVTYTAVIGASNPNLELFPGMTANVRIVTDTRENVLKVPNSALRFRPAGTAAEPRDAGAGAAESGAAPDEERKKGPRAEQKGGQKGEGQLERLTKELKLTPEQRSKVETILNETRDRIRAVPAEDKGERRKQAERARAESRSRIAEVLTPEQRKRYEEMNPARGAGGRPTVTRGRVWVQGPDGKPKAVEVRLGLSDGTHSEIVSGDLQEGTQVIVGIQSDGKGQAKGKGGPRFGF